MSATSDRPATPADYRLLDVPFGVAVEDLKSAYKRAARRCHPDANPGDPGASARFLSVQQAFWAIRDRPLATRPAGPARPATPTPRRPPPPPSGPERLATMAFGSRLWAPESALLVAPDRSCYLEPAVVGSRIELGDHHLEVWRTLRGFATRVPIGTGRRWQIGGGARSGLAVVELWIGTRQMTGARPGAAGALLPHELIESTVGNVPLGARRFTVASALRIDPSGTIWLNGDESVATEPGITTPVRVELFADGLHVQSDIPLTRWRAEPPPRNDARWIEATAAVLGGTALRRPAAGGVPR